MVFPKNLRPTSCFDSMECKCKIHFLWEILLANKDGIIGHAVSEIITSSSLLIILEMK